MMMIERKKRGKSVLRWGIIHYVGGSGIRREDGAVSAGEDSRNTNNKCRRGWGHGKRAERAVSE